MKIASSFNLLAFVSIFAILTACCGRKYESPRGLGGLIIGETTSAEAMALIEPGTTSVYDFQRGRWGSAIDSNRKARQVPGYTQYYTSYHVQFADLDIDSIELLFKSDTLIAISFEPGGWLSKDVYKYMRDKYGSGYHYTETTQYYKLDFEIWTYDNISMFRYRNEFPVSDRYEIYNRAALEEYDAIVAKNQGRKKERPQKVKSL